MIWAAYVIVGNGRGATLGKRWAGPRVVDAAGAAPGLQRAAVRILIPLAANLMTWTPPPFAVQPGGRINLSPEAALPFLISWLIYAVDALWMIWDPRKQTLHDKLAGTFVIIPW